MAPVDAASLAKILGKPKKLADGSWKCTCPAHDDRKPSLHLTDADDRVLWRCMVGCDQAAVTELIKAKLNGGAAHLRSSPLKRRATPKQAASNFVSIMPAPADATPPSFVHSKHGKASAVWTYRDEEDRVLFHVARFDTSDGKEMLPRSWGTVRNNGSGNTSGWHWRAVSSPRPLYALDVLAAKPSVPVVVVEGEKCADAGNTHFGTDFAFTTWPGGAAAVKHVDWAPLQGRQVLIWPDADDPGMRAANAIKEIVGDAKITPLPEDLPKGFDIADALIQWPIGRVRDVLCGRDAGRKDQFDPLPPVVALGFEGERFVYLSQLRQDLTILSADQHTEANLTALAHLSYWRAAFPSERKAFNLPSARDALMSAAAQRGVFASTRVRGRGIWDDKGRVVVHRGDHLDVDGEKCALGKIKSRHVYVSSDPWDLDAPPATGDQAKHVLTVSKMLLWDDPKSAVLLAGWLAIAPLCGVLAWRPSIWMTGPSGAGKSWVMSHIVEPLLGGSAIHVQGATTEAGIRQTLRADARPIMFDEAEAEDQRGLERMQTILQFARSAANDAAMVLKGSATGRPALYRARAAFCLSSVGVTLARSADQSRFTVLGLRDTREQPYPQRHFAKLVEACAVIDQSFGQRIMARTATMMPIMRQNIRVFTEASAMVLRDSRAADQIGALLAGAHLLGSDQPASLAKAREWLMRHDWLEISGRGDLEDHDQCWKTIKEVRISVEIATGNRRITLSIGELLTHLRSPEPDLAAFGVDSASAKRALSAFGIRFPSEIDVEKAGITRDHVLVANQNLALGNALKGTPWVNWARFLGRIVDSVRIPYAVRFASGVSKCTALPVDLEQE